MSQRASERAQQRVSKEIMYLMCSLDMISRERASERNDIPLLNPLVLASMIPRSLDKLRSLVRSPAPSHSHNSSCIAVLTYFHVYDTHAPLVLACMIPSLLTRLTSLVRSFARSLTRSLARFVGLSATPYSRNHRICSTLISL